jgi:4-oxalocrotonate tautomerase
MPLVEIKDVTDSIVSVAGEALRPHTWVIVSEIRSGSWGVGGDALGLKDVRASGPGSLTPTTGA